MLIGGDSFAEIIRDDDGQLLNLKPLNPERVKIIVNEKGFLKRYDYLMPGGRIASFNPDEIFNLSRHRIGDEIHGTSFIEALEGLIKMHNEAKIDQAEIIHRFATPKWNFKVDADSPAKISSFITQWEKAINLKENLVTPKDVVEAELIAVPSNSTMSPLPWIQHIVHEYFQQSGVPMIVVGGSQELSGEASKISYLSFEQTVEAEQLYLEEQTLYQLGLEINLEFPASLRNE